MSLVSGVSRPARHSGIERQHPYALPDVRKTIECSNGHDLTLSHEIMECPVVVDEAYIAEMHERFRTSPQGGGRDDQATVRAAQFGFAARTRSTPGHVPIAPGSTMGW